MSELEILDPTAGTGAAHWSLAPPLASAAGRRLALLDISKPRGDVYLDALERLLATRGVAASRYRKVTMARPARPEQLREMVAECDAAVVALAD